MSDSEHLYVGGGGCSGSSPPARSPRASSTTASSPTHSSRAASPSATKGSPTSSHSGSEHEPRLDHDTNDERLMGRELHEHYRRAQEPRSIRRELPLPVISSPIIGGNLALMSARNIERQRTWDQVICTIDLAVLHALSIKEGNYLFPLYLYPTTVTSPSPSGGPAR